MDTLTFISKLIESLAWPLALLAIAMVFRRDISAAFSKVTRVRYKDAEIDFQASLREASAAARAKGVETKESEPDLADELDELSPRGSILESWLEVERALIKFNKRHGLHQPSESRGAHRNLLQILDHDALDRDTVRMLNSLRNARNEAVHLQDRQIRPEAAREYRAISQQVVEAIENA